MVRETTLSGMLGALGGGIVLFRGVWSVEHLGSNYNDMSLAETHVPFDDGICTFVAWFGPGSFPPSAPDSQYDFGANFRNNVSQQLCTKECEM